MYTEHFGLNEKPFSISPDPRYLYLSQRHADALAHLLYGIRESGGFIQLTGEVGTGKTTLIRSVLGQLPEKTEIALILNPQLSTKQFLQAICHELGIEFVQRDTARALIDKLNERLLALNAEDRRVVLIVDEAQTMSPELLEQVRLLTNLETAKRKLLQIILIGQPELRSVLGRTEMRQIAQRITGRYHLEPLDARDTAAYVSHRMKVAGGRPGIFSRRAVNALFRLSRGIPRLINVVADRALLAAYSRDTTRIDAGLVRRAATEVFGTRRTRRWWPWAATAGAAAALWLVTSGVVEQGTGDTIELALAEVETTGAGRESATGDPVPPSAGVAASTSRPALSRLADLLGSTDEDATTRALFDLWDAEFVPGQGTPCEQAAAQNLACLVLAGGSISEIRALGRPARLELLDDAGTAHALLLTGLGPDLGAVDAGREDHLIAIAELTRYQYGDHLLLFRPAIGLEPAPLAEGARGPDVVWLRASLEGLSGRRLESIEPDVFDAELAAAVRDYQSEHSLVVDGVVGGRTLIELQSDVGLVDVRLATVH